MFARRKPETSLLPFSAWGTKGFDFWTFLSVFLKEAAPKAILELGCGRSSLLFAEYSYASGASFVGIENDRRWFNKTTLDISLLGFATRHIAHVGLAADGTWYDREAFAAATRNPGYFDFCLVDAPNEKQFFADEAEIAARYRRDEGNPFAHRDDPAGIAAIRAVTRDCAVMMVDDVHKPHLFRTVDQMLTGPASYEKHYFVYHPHPTTTNVLCICIRQGAAVAARLSTIADFLGVRLARDFTPDSA